MDTSAPPVKKPSKKFFSPTKIVVFASVLLLLVAGLVILILKRTLIFEQFQRLIAYSQKKFVTHPARVLLIFYALSAPCQALCLPLQSVLGACLSMLIDNTLLTSLLYAYFSTFNSIVIFFLSRNLCGGVISRKLAQNELYSLFSENLNKHPWRNTALVRVLYIPQGMKDYFLVFLGLDFVPFITMTFPGHFLFGLEAATIGSSISQVSAFADGRKGASKYKLIYSISCAVVLIGVCTGLAFWAKRQLAKRKKEKEAASEAPKDEKI